MERKFNIRNFHVFYTIFEVYMMVVTIPVHMIALFLQEQLQILPMAPLDDGLSLFKFNIVSVPVLIIGFVFYGGPGPHRPGGDGAVLPPADGKRALPKYFTDRNEPAQLGWVLMALSIGGLIGALSWTVLSKFASRRGHRE